MADHDPLVLVARYAHTLGLHGVFILSPKCETCGACHDFSLVADLGDDEVKEIVAQYASRMNDDRFRQQVTILGKLEH